VGGGGFFCCTSGGKPQIEGRGGVSRGEKIKAGQRSHKQPRPLIAEKKKHLGGNDVVESHPSCSEKKRKGLKRVGTFVTIEMDVRTGTRSIRKYCDSKGLAAIAKDRGSVTRQVKEVKRL